MRASILLVMPLTLALYAGTTQAQPEKTPQNVKIGVLSDQGNRVND